jgi:hypothetical protein
MGTSPLPAPICTIKSADLMLGHASSADFRKKLPNYVGRHLCARSETIIFVCAHSTAVSRWPPLLWTWTLANCKICFPNLWICEMPALEICIWKPVYLYRDKRDWQNWFSVLSSALGWEWHAMSRYCTHAMRQIKACDAIFNRDPERAGELCWRTVKVLRWRSWPARYTVFAGLACLWYLYERMKAWIKSRWCGDQNIKSNTASTLHSTVLQTLCPTASSLHN